MPLIVNDVKSRIITMKLKILIPYENMSFVEILFVYR